MTPSKTYKTYMAVKRHGFNYTESEQNWIKSMFSVIHTVAKKKSEFTVDDIWAEYDRQRSKGKIAHYYWMDNRILGPMIRHMVSEGLLGSTGYYTKSTRHGGGSRPVTIWQSFIATSKTAA